MFEGAFAQLVLCGREVRVVNVRLSKKKVVVVVVLVDIAVVANTVVLKCPHIKHGHFFFFR